MKLEHGQELNNRCKQITTENTSKKFKSMNPHLIPLFLFPRPAQESQKQSFAWLQDSFRIFSLSLWNYKFYMTESTDIWNHPLVSSSRRFPITKAICYTIQFTLWLQSYKSGKTNLLSAEFFPTSGV